LEDDGSIPSFGTGEYRNFYFKHFGGPFCSIHDIKDKIIQQYQNDKTTQKKIIS